MSYFGSAMGDVTASDFVTVSGVCKPTNFATLDKFKELQRQLNRGAAAKKLPPIAVDGDLGPGTVKLANAVFGMWTGCADLAVKAEDYTATVKALATAQGVPASVGSPKPLWPPAIVNATTGVLTPQPATSSVLDAFNNMDTTGKLVAAAVLGGVAYFALGKKKRRK